MRPRLPAAPPGHQPQQRGYLGPSCHPQPSPGSSLSITPSGPSHRTAQPSRLPTDMCKIICVHFAEEESQAEKFSKVFKKT